MHSWDRWRKCALTLCILTVIIYIIYKFTPANDKLEYFENGVANGVANEYVKLSETYLDDANLKVDLLYANYSGEEVKNDVKQESWANKSLAQCTDTCNKLSGCTGFSRDLVGDDELATCYPRTAIDKCHSYRKGSFTQRQHALAYNTYIKTTTPNALTQCLGDSKLTLNRPIYIKSYAHPDRYIGLNTGGEIGLIQANESGVDFGQAAKFIITTGMDGSGTVSFKHMATNKYLYRDAGDMITGKLLTGNIDNISTDDRQRASFNIEDGMSNNIVIKCLSLQLENAERYISVYPKNNKYLNVQSVSELDVNNTSNQTKKSIKQLKMITFEIVDTIITSTVLDSRKYIKDVMEPIRTYPATHNRQIATDSIVAPIILKYNDSNIIQSFADINAGGNAGGNAKGNAGGNAKNSSTPTVPLDNSMDDYNYYKLMSGKTGKTDLSNYIDDKYLSNQASNPILNKEKDLVSQLNMMQGNATVDDATKKAQLKYKNLKDMNKHIEKLMNTENMHVNSTSEILTSNLDKMKIQDLSKDYFFLKNISS